MRKTLRKKLGKVGNLSGETALRQLVGQTAGVLTNKAAPLSAASLEPLIGALLQVGEVVAARLADEVVNKLMAGVAEKLTDKVLAKYTEQIAVAIANAVAENVGQQLAGMTLVTRVK